MLNRKKLYWALQIVGWLVYVLIVGFFNLLTHHQFKLDLIYSLFSIYLIGIVGSHCYRTIIVKFNWVAYNLPRLIPRVLLGTIVFGTIIYFLQLLVIDVIIVDKPFEFNLANAFPSIVNWILLGLLWSLFYFSFHFITNYKREEIKNLKWQAAKNEIELNKLKSQLNPHFIFNAMNSIRALIEEDPSLAKNAITQLSNVLRNSLLMGKKKLITFSEELKIIDDYLSLEKTRFEERLNIVKNIDKNTSSFMVPPLMVQTLVENGIKHGISKIPEGGTLNIKASLNNDQLEITIYNDGEYDKNQLPSTGFGLVNTTQRLQLLYGNKSKLHIGNNNNKVETFLLIPKEALF